MRGRITYHKHALTCCFHTFFKSLLLCLSQIVLWLCFAALSVHCWNKLSFFAFGVLIPCLVLLFIYRFYITNKLYRYLRPDAPKLKSFFKLIPSAIYRLITGVIWCSPFAALMYKFYQYVFVLPATTFSNDFTKLGAFITSASSGEIQLLIGTVVFFSALVFAMLLFLYGWRRGFSFDLAQTQPLSFRKSLQVARKMRKRSRTRRFLNTILHAVILLPAIIVPLTLPMMQLYPLLTGKAMNDVQLIYVYLSAGIVSDGTLLLSAGLFLLLYLPMLPFRKLHNIAAVVIRHE